MNIQKRCYKQSKKNINIQKINLKLIFKKIKLLLKKKLLRH